MLLHVQHRTHYVYPSPAAESHNELRLMPLTDADQTCRQFQVTTVPTSRIFSYEEPWGTVHHFNVPLPHRELTVTAEAEVETRLENPFRNLNMVEDDWAFYGREGLRQDYAEYLAPTRLVPLNPEAYRIGEIARRQAKGPSVASYLVSLTRLLHKLLIYDPEATHVHTPLDTFLENRRGVCQDFAHTLLAACRTHGLPARYISGYMYGAQGAITTHADQATHAWVECLLPGEFGRGAWHGFDPTNNLLTNHYYIKAHRGRDYHDVSPTKGVYRGPGAHSLEVSVEVTKI